MVQIDLRRPRPRVAAGPRPRFVDENRWTQSLAGARAAGRPAGAEVRIHATCGGVRVAGDQVAGHEAGRVIRGVLAGPEAVDTADNVLAAQARVVASDALALDDRVRVVFSVTDEDLDRQNRDVGPAVRPQDVGAGTGFRAGLHDQGPAPRQFAGIESGPHAVAQPFVQLHFSGAGVDIREVGRPRPARLDGSQNRGRGVGSEIDERSPGGGREVMRRVRRNCRRRPRRRRRGRIRPSSAGGRPA